VADRSATKTLFAIRRGHHFPRWCGIPVRVFLLTFVGTLSAFAGSLLLAIVGTLIVSALRGLRPDMRIAYWDIAFPLALVAGVIIFVVATVLEIRHYQQRETLNAIERMG
jgi:hypothetical protein